MLRLEHPNRFVELVQPHLFANRSQRLLFAGQLLFQKIPSPADLFRNAIPGRHCHEKSDPGKKGRAFILFGPVGAFQRIAECDATTRCGFVYVPFQSTGGWRRRVTATHQFPSCKPLSSE